MKIINIKTTKKSKIKNRKTKNEKIKQKENKIKNKIEKTNHMSVFTTQFLSQI